MKNIPNFRGYSLIFHILFCFIFLPLSAQTDFTEFSGKIIDGETKKSLEAASLSINETNISTVTNSDGEFLLKVPTTNLGSKVIVSLLGYNSYALPLSELSTTDSEIELFKSANELSEVNISTFKYAKDLVKKVFSEKRNTTQNETVYMTAFYRETIKRRNRNVSLTEAVVNILKSPNTKSTKDIIKLSKARKSTDYKRLDTLSVKLVGGPFSTIYIDMMKYPEFIFNEDNIDNYKFTFDSPSAINNRNVYVVKFEPNFNYVNANYEGKLFIDVVSLALVSADYSLDLSNSNKTKNLLVEKKPRNVEVYPIEARYKVNYKSRGDVWYYSYSNLNLKFKVNKKREIFNKVYSLSSEMAVTDWEINNTGKKIKIKERLKPTVIINDAISGFSDPDFWGKYNLIEPDKTIDSAIEKIRKSIERERDRAKS